MMARSNQNVIRLLSQERLQGYDNNISKHSQNLHLIAKITPCCIFSSSCSFNTGIIIITIIRNAYFDVFTFWLEH